MNRQLISRAKNAGIKVIAHRGASKNSENELSDLINCFNFGFDAVETDVHFSKDGKIVISHDPDLKRMFNVDKKICNCSISDLRKIADKNKLPLLEEFFSEIKNSNAEIHLELKEYNKALYLELVKLIKKYNLEKSVRVIGFIENAQDVFLKSDNDNIKKGLIKRLPNNLLKFSKKNSLNAVGIGWAKKYQYKIFKLLAKIINLKQKIETLKNKGKIVTVGTVSSVKEFEFALSLAPSEILVNYIE